MDDWEIDYSYVGEMAAKWEMLENVIEDLEIILNLKPLDADKILEHSVVKLRKILPQKYIGD